MIADREVRILLKKEWRQLTANRGAMAGAFLVPVFALGVLPLFLMLSVRNAPPSKMPAGGSIGLFAEVGHDPTRLPVALLPMLVSFVGVILPTMLVTYLVISERETRTLELLVALPVRIDQLLRAKLLAVIIATSSATVPLVAIDCVVAVASGLGTVSDVLGLPFLLVCVLGFSTSAALLVALLARDWRTANSVAGFFMVPALLLTMAGTAVLPGGWVRPVVIGIAFAVAGLVIARVALRSVTFERLMS
jgi:ABC-type transport system involved in multi-copper enzyme maturation permease subunit